MSKNSEISVWGSKWGRGKTEKQSKELSGCKTDKNKKKRSKPLRFQTFLVGPSVEIRTQGLLNPIVRELWKYETKKGEK